MLFSLIAIGSTTRLTAQQSPEFSRLAAPGRDGKLAYAPYSDLGDVLPDFSHCGYGGGGVRIPTARVKATLDPQPDSADDTARIQAAIDQVAALPPDRHGLRGAVLLRRGAYRVEGTLHIRAGGVVLRGEGEAETGTVLLATGTRRRTLIQIQGTAGPREVSETRQPITTPSVPVGAKSFEVPDGSRYHRGDTVFVSRMGNADWISAIGMDRIQPRPGNPRSTRQWEPFALRFDRVITEVEGNRITVDAPIVCAIEARWGGGEIRQYEDPGRIQHSGVEHLRADAAFDPSVKRTRNNAEYFADEAHATQLVRFDNAKNCWARNLTALHFYHGVAAIERNAKWITVQDCNSLEPVSEITGGRRYPFSINGQLSLVQRCYSRDARHAFVLGSRVAGPNVFLHCRSEQDHATSEPHHRWSVGGLFDNVQSRLAIQDRQWMGSGHGWSGANYVTWNCSGTLVCQQPPTAQNFAIGFVGQKTRGAFDRPDGWWESEGRHVAPQSLYLQQLEDRLGRRALRAAIASSP